MSERETIHTDQAPKAIGPYSQAVVAHGFVFCSGQIGLTPEGERVVGGVAAEARQTLENLRRVLEAAGSGLERVVKVTIYLADMADFAAVNAVYSEYFPEDPPARAAVAVRQLPKDFLVEMDAIALVGRG